MSAVRRRRRKFWSKLGQTAEKRSKDKKGLKKDKKVTDSQEDHKNYRCLFIFYQESLTFLNFFSSSFGRGQPPTPPLATAKGPERSGNIKKI